MASSAVKGAHLGSGLSQDLRETECDPYYILGLQGMLTKSFWGSHVGHDTSCLSAPPLGRLRWGDVASSRSGSLGERIWNSLWVTLILPPPPTPHTLFTPVSPGHTLSQASWPHQPGGFRQASSRIRWFSRGRYRIVPVPYGGEGGGSGGAGARLSTLSVAPTLELGQMPRWVP